MISYNPRQLPICIGLPPNISFYLIIFGHVFNDFHAHTSHKLRITLLIFIYLLTSC